MLTQTKTSETLRQKNFDILEAEKLENVRLTGQLFLYEAKFKEMQTYAQRYYKKYKHFEKKYGELKAGIDSNNKNV